MNAPAWSVRGRGSISIARVRAVRGLGPYEHVRIECTYRNPSDRRQPSELNQLAVADRREEWATKTEGAGNRFPGAVAATPGKSKRFARTLLTKRGLCRLIV